MAEKIGNKWEEKMIQLAMVVVVVGTLIAIIIYIHEAFKLKLIPILSESAAETAGLVLSIVGAILGFIALYMYLKVEKEVAQRKIEEKNIEKELARNELLAIIRNFDSYYEKLTKKRILKVSAEEKNINLIYGFIDNWFKDLEEALKKFIGIGGHLIDSRDLVSKYKGREIKLDISIRYLLSEPLKKIIKLNEHLIDTRVSVSKHKKYEKLINEREKLINNIVSEKIMEIWHNILNKLEEKLNKNLLDMNKSYYENLHEEIDHIVKEMQHNYISTKIINSIKKDIIKSIVVKREEYEKLINRLTQNFTLKNLLYIIKNLEKQYTNLNVINYEELYEKLDQFIKEMKNNPHVIESKPDSPNSVLNDIKNSMKQLITKSVDSKKTEFTSDTILKKINELLYNILLVKKMLKKHVSRKRNDHTGQLEFELDTRISDILIKSKMIQYELYLLLAYKIKVEYVER